VTGYLPTAEVLALILATPIPWVRKWKALLAGLVLVHVLVLLRVLVVLIFGFSAAGAVALFHPGPLARSALTMLFNVVAVGISFTYVAPVFLWIAVAIRQQECQAGGRESGP
jgi:exosortase/archaeosortase